MWFLLFFARTYWVIEVTKMHVEWGHNFWLGSPWYVSHATIMSSCPKTSTYSSHHITSFLCIIAYRLRLHVIRLMPSPGWHGGQSWTTLVGLTWKPLFMPACYWRVAAPEKSPIFIWMGVGILEKNKSSDLFLLKIIGANLWGEIIDGPGCSTPPFIYKNMWPHSV